MNLYALNFFRPGADLARILTRANHLTEDSTESYLISISLVASSKALDQFLPRRKIITIRIHLLNGSSDDVKVGKSDTKNYHRVDIAINTMINKFGRD